MDGKMEEIGLLKFYILEDNPTDAELIIRHLKKDLASPFDYKLTDRLDTYLSDMETYIPDLVLTDFFLPDFTGLDVLSATKRISPDLPVIIVTGTVDEETAIACMKTGAADYVQKHNLSRLVPSINNTVERITLTKKQNETRMALARNERELDLIFNRSPIKMMVIDKEMNIRKANRKILDFSKRTTNDLLNKKVGTPLNCILRVKNNCFPESERCKECELIRFLHDSISNKLEHNASEINIEVAEDGNLQKNTYEIFIEELEPHAIESYLVTLINISERRRNLQKIQESEKKFRELADALPEVVFEIDNSAVFKFLNKAAFQKFRIDSNLYQPEHLSVYQFIHPDDLEKFNGNLDLGIAGVPISGEDYKIMLPDNQTGYFQIFYSNVVQNNQIVGFRGIAIDITERKKMELELRRHREELETLIGERTAEFEEQARQLKESQLALSYLLDDVNESREELLASNREIKKLSQALEQSPSSVLITDIYGNIEYVNKQFEVTSGYNTKELIGKNPRILNSGVHTKDFFAGLWNRVKSGQKWSGEICNRRKNGELYWEFSSVSPLRNSDNEITNFVAVKEDITEKKLIEQKLKDYTNELELFNKLMVDREFKIIEMKEEVNQLRNKLGLEIKYPPIWNDGLENS